MYLERFFVEGLAHASYLFGKDGQAAVVDPKRDVDDYLKAAEREGLKIVAVLVTHAHADYVGGHVELAQRAGATIYHSAKAPAQYPFHGLHHGEDVFVGPIRVKGLDTPGHTPDSMSFYLEADGERILFSGDALFVGDVGRPDLVDMKVDPRVLAGDLYDTLHDVLYHLPDDTIVYPAHGAGSLCGRKIGTAPSTTVGAEKLANWANQFRTRDEFIEAMVANLPDRPFHFYHDPFVNLAGPRPLAEVPKPALIQPGELQAEYAGALVLDVRTPERYGAAHLAGSLNIGGHLPVFSTWTGMLIRPETSLVLVVEEPEAAERAWLDLARIGYETIQGYLVADAEAWRAAGLEVRETPQLEVCCLDQWMREGRRLLDVRTCAEWNQGGVEGAVWINLSRLGGRLDEVPAGPLAVMCGTGYRSSIAVSLLEREGRADLVNVKGGWAAYAQRMCAEPDTYDFRCADVFERMPVAA